MPTDSHRPPNPPRGPRPPRTPGSRPALKLRRDDADAGTTEPVTYKFPTPGFRDAGPLGGQRAASRSRLVAAKVTQDPVEETFTGSACGVLNGGDDPHCIGRIISSGQLVREIEHTLDRMQNRLSNFREEMDRAFRFPAGRVGDDGDLPPAA